MIFDDELIKFNEKDNITIVNTLTNKFADGFLEGRISKEMITQNVTDLSNKLWYVCGPPPMVESMKGILRELEVPEEMWRIEDWQIAGKHDGDK